jgi:hypothetical protein
MPGNGSRLVLEVETVMQVDFWVDPRCPWTWTTARWLAEDVAPNRDLTISWNTMSLFLAKGVDESSPVFEKLWFCHRLLRVMEAVKQAGGSDDAGSGAIYFEFATRIWYDRDWDFDPADALTAVGLSSEFATAFSEDSWDTAIRESMATAYGLIGDGVGNTPIIGITNNGAKTKALYGPILTRRPDQDQSLALWDSIVELTTNDVFVGLNRQLPELPDFGARPISA